MFNKSYLNIDANKNEWFDFGTIIYDKENFFELEKNIKYV